MKQFQCNTLVPGCDWQTRHENQAEIVRRVAEHLRTAHGETVVRPNMVVEVKKRIKDVESA